jgi:hypothetical protein
MIPSGWRAAFCHPALQIMPYTSPGPKRMCPATFRPGARFVSFADARTKPEEPAGAAQLLSDSTFFTRTSRSRNS